MSNDDTITIRPAEPNDRATLDRLAGRDSTLLPDDDFLVAEVAGEPWAAIGLRTGALAADPFRPSGEVAELLRMRVLGAENRAPIAGPDLAPLRRLARRAVMGPAG
jgi:hypothetical protein